jgi:hypothetical protein
LCLAGCAELELPWLPAWRFLTRPLPFACASPHAGCEPAGDGMPVPAIASRGIAAGPLVAGPRGGLERCGL